MSRTSDTTRLHQNDPPKPLDPISDWNRANWARAHFDYDGLGHAIKIQAARRSPDSSTEWRHQVGFACEVAASSVVGVSANWQIYDDYTGDNGFDFVHEGQPVEVKGTTDIQNPELSISVDEIDDADQFILCVCEDPRRRIYVVGYISRPDLKTYGSRFDDRIIAGLESLEPFEPRELFPDEIREIQDPNGNLGLQPD